MAEQNGCHFTNAISKWNFVNEKFYIVIQISLKFVPEGPIEDKTALAELMDWHWSSCKPLPKPIMTKLSI